MTLITRSDSTVPIIVSARTHLKPKSAFDLIAPIDLPSVFQAIPPFPRVVRVDNQTDTWDHVGPSRNPQFSDGSQATERLTEYVDGHSFAYELTGFTNILSRLAVGIRGEWTFTPDGSGTFIRWSYEFKPLPGRRWILAGPFTPLWRRYMRAAIAAAVALAESSHS